MVFLLFSTLVTFAGALLVERAEPKKKKFYMWLTFLCSLGVLGFLKYFDFLLGNVNTVLGMAGIGPVNKPFSTGPAGGYLLLYLPVPGLHGGRLPGRYKGRA